jgi:hypothetical protein
MIKRDRGPRFEAAPRSIFEYEHVQAIQRGYSAGRKVGGGLAIDCESFRVLNTSD